MTGYSMSVKTGLRLVDLYPDLKDDIDVFPQLPEPARIGLRQIHTNFGITPAMFGQLKYPKNHFQQMLRRYSEVYNLEGDVHGFRTIHVLQV